MPSTPPSTCPGLAPPACWSSSRTALPSRSAPRRTGASRRLKKTGCAVLWLALQPDATPIEGALSIKLADPADAVVAIGQAAARALAAT